GGGVAVLPLAAVSDRNGHRFDVDRTPDGTPTAVRHTGGYRIAVETTVDGQVHALRLLGTGTSTSTSDGGEAEPVRLVEFGYDTDNRLAEVVNSSGLPLRFGYDPVGRLTGWTDRNRTWCAYTYDDTGRCVRTTGPDGYLTGSFTYQPAADGTGTGTTVHTDSLGHQSSFAYNTFGQVVRETDPLGHTTVSDWDRYDRLLARTDPLDRTTTYRYDSAGNLVELVRPDGATATASYDEQHRPTLVVDPDGARWQRTYDQHGNLTAVTDPLGHTTRYTHHPHRPGHLSAVTDALGHTTQVETNPAGLPTQLRTPAGATTRITYGPDGRTTHVLDPVGGTSRYTWTVEGKLATRTTPDGATEHFTYDPEGNLTAHTDPAGLTTRHTYTHFDLPAARTDPDGTRLTFDYDTELRLTTVTNPQHLTWTYAYDPAGHLTTETDFDGRTTRYDHDPAGHLTARTDPAGHTTTFVRAPLGEVVERRTTEAVTSIGYDPAGRLVQAANADVAVTFVRNALGMVVAESVDSRTSTSAYDALGRRTRRTTPSGLVSTWEWDADGMPLALRVADRVLAFARDAAGRETGRRLDSGLAFALSWDAAHRLVSQTVTAPESPAARTSGGRGRRLVHHRGYVYSADGYLTVVDDMHYGARGYTLDSVRRVTAITGLAGSEWRETYAYDSVGNVTDAAWPQSSQPQSLRAGHPRVDRIDAGAQGDRTYAGTRLRRAGRVRFEYDSQGRVTLRQQKRLSGPPRTWRYAWDTDDRLTGVVTPDGQRWRYVYDPFGRRIAKQRVAFDGDVLDEVRFSWDGMQLAEQSREYDGRVQSWEWQPDGHRPLAQIERIPLPGQAASEHGGDDQEQAWYDSRFYAIVTDLVGAPTELVDPDGTLAWQHRTTLWGVPTGDNGQNTVDCPLRFPGQYHDPETGLDYNVHRHYDPSTARYQSPDPLGLAPAPNPVTYVPNPQAWIDPLGLTPCSTGTVWDDMRSTQPNYPGSVLPRSFTMAAGGQQIWVHPNATKHMAEYLQGLATSGATRARVDLATQVQLGSLRSAVGDVASGGVPINQLVHAGGWELRFGQRSTDPLPALMHALYIG
nr:RHS repeat-associated core domain-containing protein [Micromonospora sp. DSM 115978]